MKPQSAVTREASLESTTFARRSSNGTRILRASALAVALFAAVPSLAAANPSLLSPSAQLPAQANAVAVARSRAVAVDFGLIDPAGRSAPAAIDVELFDGQVVTLERSRIESRGPNNYTWFGWIQGKDTGQAILTVVNGQMAGSITTFDRDLHGGKTFQIQSDGKGANALRLVDPQGFPSDHPPGAEKLVAPKNAALQTRAVAADTLATVSATTSATTLATTSGDAGDTIDVMVVYSNQTATAAGTAIGAQIQQAIDSANAAYANSGVNTRLRLVHFAPVAYDESGDFNTDLNRLTSGTDGYMDNVATLRNTYAADLVSLFIENGQYCGMAWIGPSAGYGFSVINRGCASGNLSFAHELGHNFGARHDTYVDPSTTPYAHGHGHLDTAEAWRTVMAYNNGCAAVGKSCVRVPYFSNPNLTYGANAHPLGDPTTANNARVHNDNAVTVANFRSAVTLSCTYTLSPTSASVGATGGVGSTTVTTGASCPWSVTSSASWLGVTSATSGTGSATISWTAAANTSTQRSANLTIGGATFVVTEAAAAPVALPAAAKLSATSLSFSNQKVGTTSATKTVTLSNSGGGTLTVNALTAGGTNAGEFARSGSCAVGTALAAGQSCTLVYTFTPTATGSRSASLTIATSAANLSLKLSGKGVSK